MFFRLLFESFYRQRRRKLLAGVAIFLGTTAVTAMLALALGIGDRIHQELAVYGANIVVTPQAATLDVKVGGVNLKPATGGAYLRESDLAKLRGIFWANNITGVSPELDWSGDASQTLATGPASIPVQVRGLWFDQQFGSIKTGALRLHPWWKLTGALPTYSTQGIHEVTGALVGQNVAARLRLKVGSPFEVLDDKFRSAHISNDFVVTGIVATGDSTDDAVLAPLTFIQRLMQQPDAVSRVEISARTKPEDAFAKSDPDKLSPKLRDVWYCRPYANSIAYQIREAIPGAQAEQVRRVEQSEGTVLSRISGLMWLISAAALLAAGFAVSAAMATAILERRAEIGLMRSLGASRGVIALLFYAETGVLAVFAGACGYLVGSGLAAWLGARIFSPEGATPAAATYPLHLSAVLNPVLLPVIVGLALFVAIAGSTPAIRSALKMDPTGILRANA